MCIPFFRYFKGTFRHFENPFISRNDIFSFCKLDIKPTEVTEVTEVTLRLRRRSIQVALILTYKKSEKLQMQLNWLLFQVIEI